ncbi:hypothetical protein M9Y10_011413 [Tritrichomonas musculus]|uniref:Actin family protein n=1 Tax=Tritrichomonas musculus TaxID=1915356 RepID=A0ABR2ILM2_9EUKA
MTEEFSTLIYDIGSYSIKAGMNTDKSPRFIISTAFPAGETDFPLEKQIPEDSKVEFCVKNGEIVNKERLIFIVASIFAEYFPEEEDEPSKLRIVFSNIPYSSKKTIGTLAEIAFEILPADELLIKPPALFTLSLYTQMTSICVDIGHDVTHVVPLEDGYVVPKGIMRTFAGGSAIDMFVAAYHDKLTEFQTWGQYLKAIKFKESNAKVAKENIEDEISEEESDDAICGYMCGELLFNPSLFEAANPDDQSLPTERVSSLMETESVQALISKSIEQCDLKNRGALWNNIILTGGTSKIAGFKERLQAELEKIAPTMINPKVIFADDPQLSCWSGCKLCVQFSQTEKWFSKDQYDDDPSKASDFFLQYGNLC